ncbi:PDZ and LIM domain protein 2 [Platysternon megacephalum]|uniref:PDZ and LIM domain protein 2 n=1 Tax=Platysternon megacephalum TaxID=55544 RepID=A0A4D9EEM3_9SAUR|nr:PDZ and LIM domain protein 2 [Platysternon megacephalum]
MNKQNPLAEVWESKLVPNSQEQLSSEGCVSHNWVGSLKKQNPHRSTQNSHFKGRFESLTNAMCKNHSSLPTNICRLLYRVLSISLSNGHIPVACRIPMLYCRILTMSEV